MLSLTITIPLDTEIFHKREEGKYNDEILIVEGESTWSSAIYEVWKDLTPQNIFNDIYYKISQIQADTEQALALQDYSKKTVDDLEAMKGNIVDGYTILRKIDGYKMKSLEYKLERLITTFEKYVFRRQINLAADDLYEKIYNKIKILEQETETSFELCLYQEDFDKEAFYADVDEIKTDLYVLHKLGHPGADNLLDDLLEIPVRVEKLLEKC